MAWHRCEQCGKKFAFQKSLIEHQVQAEHGSSLTRTSPPLLASSAAAATTTTTKLPPSSSSLQSAEWPSKSSHHSEALRCPQCPYEAVGGNPTALEIHVRLQHGGGGTSSGQRTLAAGGARFSYKSHLTSINTAAKNRRSSIHSNNNNNKNTTGFKCNKCRKGFDSLPALVRHKEILHPSEDQYALQLKPTRNTNFPKSKSGLKCRLCGKAFPTPFSLEQHLVKKHRSPSVASANSFVSRSGSASGSAASSGPATSPDSCTGGLVPAPVPALALATTSARSAALRSSSGQALQLRSDRCHRALIDHRGRSSSQIVSQNYGPALTNKATEFPVIYRVKSFKLGRSLVIIRVTSH